MKIYGRIYYSVLLLLWLILVNMNAAEWQWSVELKGIVSGETNSHPRAFLWIPPDCQQVKAMVVGQHNMSEEGILEHPDFRKALSEIDFAEIWITPAIDINWDVTKGTQQIFEQMMEDFASISGYSELKYAPVVPIGHSAMATYPWNFGAWNPERTLAILSVHGDSPRTHLTGYGQKNLDWEDRTIEGIPGLIVMGEYEWWEDRLFTAFDYRREYPNAPLSLLADAGHGHFDHSDMLVNYLGLFLKKAARFRLPAGMPLDQPIELNPVYAENGWLADRWHKDRLPDFTPAPYGDYQRDKNTAFWYFDEEMAQETEKYYAKAYNKKEQYIGFIRDGKLLPYNSHSHARISSDFYIQPDGVSFVLNAAYTDSLRRNKSSEHAIGKIKISRICGPVKQVNDTTFQIRFYRMGLNNTKRTADIWLLAASDGDEEYKSAVQQFNMRIPYPITEGKEQLITFPLLKNVRADQQEISLHATSDSGLPVYYYIQEGPAEIKENKIIFTKIPLRSCFPIKVTVVAWQYGIVGEWQTAIPVEQSFYIYPKEEVK